MEKDSADGSILPTSRRAVGFGAPRNEHCDRLFPALHVPIDAVYRDLMYLSVCEAVRP